VITPIPDVFAAANAFDSITYQKGHAVIHMLEDYVGPDVFRDGVRNYIAHHAYGNTVTDDLWTEIDKVSPKKITAIAHDFTLQAGVPLISIDSPAGKGVRVTQSRFGADAGSKTPRSWRTPVTVWNIGEPWKVVISADKPAVAADAVTRNAPLLNAGQIGYFRSRYSPELSARIAAAAATLPPGDQLGLIYDSQALGLAGYAPMGDFLAIARNLQAAEDTVVLKALTQQLAGLINLYRGQPGEAAYAAFARARLAPAYARVGWDAKPGEADNDALLRRTVLATLGKLDDPAVIAEARRRFTAWLAAPSTLTGTTRQTVLQIVADHADAATWDQLHALGQKATDATDKTRFYHYLGVSHDPALADKALALALTKDPPATDAPELISGVSEVYPEKAFDFAVAHRAAIDAMVEPTSRTSFLVGLASGSHDAAILPKLKAFAATVPASTRGEVTKTVSTVLYQQVIVAKRLPEVDRWLAAHPG
jgi:aminopeptidase N